MPNQDIRRLQILSLLAEIREEIQTLSTELAKQYPELLSDLDLKDILSPSPTSQTCPQA